MGIVRGAAEEQVAADHDAGSTFSGLAVDGGHVACVLRQPIVNILAKWTDQGKIWGVMIVKGKVL